MKRSIFIIHHSEIIRKGLNTILRNHFQVEITMLEKLDELVDFGQIARTHFVLFLGEENDDFAIINRLEPINRVSLVGIFNTENLEQRKHRFDFTITTNTNSEKIRNIVTSIFSDSKDLKDYAENGELTQREREILKLVALGHANKDIAGKLFISVHTVISHRKNITEKLGIKSISGLTVYAILNKIIDTDTINPENLI